jgi:hypothetical protein
MELPSRGTVMNRCLTASGVPLALAATAALLVGCTTDPGPGGAVSADPTTTSEPSSGSEPTYSPEAGEVVPLPQGTRWASMRQGRYAVPLTPALTYEVDVPDHWKVFLGRFLNTPPSGSNSIFFISSAAADDTWVPRHPCRDHTVTPVGPTVSDLAAALRRQPVLRVGEPVPVTVNGNSGMYVDVRIPDEVDSSRCVADTVALFSSGSDEWGWEEGLVGHWWILDVDGERVVINGQCDTACADDDLETLTTMAESVTFTRGR